MLNQFYTFRFKEAVYIQQVIFDVATSDLKGLVSDSKELFFYIKLWFGKSSSSHCWTNWDAVPILINHQNCLANKYQVEIYQKKLLCVPYLS